MTGREASTITMLNNKDVSGSVENHINLMVDKTSRKYPTEVQMIKTLQRVLFNYSLLLTNYGHQVKGYVNRKGVVHPKEGEIVLVGMNQTIKSLHRTENYQSKGGTHESPHPHWRTGHWRNQAHGVGHGLRKQVFIKPVFVRSDRFGGDIGTTFVEYK